MGIEIGGAVIDAVFGFIPPESLGSFSAELLGEVKKLINTISVNLNIKEGVGFEARLGLVLNSITAGNDVTETKIVEVPKKDEAGNDVLDEEGNVVTEKKEVTSVYTEAVADENKTLGVSVGLNLGRVTLRREAIAFDKSEYKAAFDISSINSGLAQGLYAEAHLELDLKSKEVSTNLTPILLAVFDLLKDTFDKNGIKVGDLTKDDALSLNMLNLNNVIKVDVYANVDLSDTVGFEGILKGIDAFIALTDASNNNRNILSVRLKNGEAYITTDLIYYNDIDGNKIYPQLKLNVLDLLSSSGMSASLSGNTVTIEGDGTLAEGGMDTSLSAILSLVMGVIKDISINGGIEDTTGIRLSLVENVFEKVLSWAGVQNDTILDLLPEIEEISLTIDTPSEITAPGTTNTFDKSILSLNFKIDDEGNPLDDYGPGTDIDVALKFTNLYAEVLESKGGKIVPREIAVAGAIDAAIANGAFIDVLNMGGIYGELSLDVNIDATENISLNLANTFREFDGTKGTSINIGSIIGASVLTIDAATNEMLTRIFTMIGEIVTKMGADLEGDNGAIIDLALKHLKGNFGIDIRFRISDLSNIKINNIDARITIVDKDNANSTVLDILLNSGDLYLDFSGFGYFGEMSKIHVDLVEFLGQFNIDITGATSGKTSEVALEGTATNVARDITIADLVRFLTGKVHPNMDSKSMPGITISNGEEGNNFIAININTMNIQKLIQEIFHIDITIDNDNSVAGIVIDMDNLGASLNIRLSRGLAIGVGIGGLGIEIMEKQETMDSADPASLATVDEKFIPGEGFSDISELKLRLDTTLTVSLTAEELDTIGLGSLINVVETGFDINIGKMAREIKVGIEAVLDFNDFYLKDNSAYGSKAKISITVTGYEAISIYTDFKAIYIDGSGFGLPRIKYDVDIIELLKGLIYPAVGDGFERPTLPENNTSGGGNVALEDRAGDILNVALSDTIALTYRDIVTIATSVVKKIQIGLLGSEIALRGDKLGDVFEIFLNRGIIPSATIDQISKFVDISKESINSLNLFDTFRLYASNKSDNADIKYNEVSVSDAELGIEITRNGGKTRIFLGIEKGDLDLVLNKDAAPVDVPADLDAFRTYDNLVIDLEAKIDIDMLARPMSNNGKIEMSLVELLGILFNNVSDGTVLSSTGTSDTKIEATLRVQFKLAELFDKNYSAETSTFAAEIKIQDKSNPNKVLDLLTVTYINNNSALYISVPMLGIAGIKLEGLVDVMGLLNGLVTDSDDMVTEDGNTVRLADGSARATSIIAALISLTIDEDGFKFALNSGVINGILSSQFVKDALNDAIANANLTGIVKDIVDKLLAGNLGDIIPPMDEVSVAFARKTADHEASVDVKVNVLDRNYKTGNTGKLTLAIKATVPKLEFDDEFENPIVRPANADQFMDFANMSQFEFSLGASLTLGMTHTPEDGALADIMGLLSGLMGSKNKSSVNILSGAEGEYRYNLSLSGKLDFSSKDAFRAYSQLALEISLQTRRTNGQWNNPMLMAGIYYYGVENAVYINLEKIGIGRIKLVGIDLAGILGSLLGDTMPGLGNDSIVTFRNASQASEKVSLDDNNANNGVTAYASGSPKLVIDFARVGSEMTIGISLNNDLITAILEFVGGLTDISAIEGKIPTFTNGINLKMVFDADPDNATTAGATGLKELSIDVDLSDSKHTADNAAKNKLTISINKLALLPFSTDTIYIPNSSERNKYSGFYLNLGIDQNGKIAVDMASVGSLIANVLDSLVNANDGSMLGASVINNVLFRGSNNTIATQQDHYMQLYIGKEISTDNRLQIDVYGDGGDVEAKVFLNQKTNALNIKLTKIVGLSLGGGIDINLNFKNDFGLDISDFGALFGGSSGSGSSSSTPDTGNNDSVENNDNRPDLGEDGGNNSSTTQVVESIEVNIGNRRQDYASSDWADELGSGEDVMLRTQIRVNLNTDFVEGIVTMLHQAILGFTGASKYSDPSTITYYLKEYVVKMAGTGLVNAVGATLCKVVSGIMPLPTDIFSAYVEILLDTNKPGAIRAIRLRLEGDTGRWDMILKVFDLGFYGVAGDITPEFSNEEQKRDRTINPYDLDENGNGKKDYLEDLPRTAKATLTSGNKTVNNVTIDMAWSDDGFKIDPTKASDTRQSDPIIGNYIPIYGYGLNAKYDGGIKAILTNSQVRRPRVTNGKYDIIVDGVAFSEDIDPSLIDPTNGYVLGTVVQIRMEDGNGNDVGYMLFDKRDGDTVVWDTSALKSTYFGQQADITLTYGNGACKDVMLTIPVRVVKKTLNGIVFNSVTDVNDPNYVYSKPFVYNAYNFKGLPDKVFARYSGSNEPQLVDIRWENAESVVATRYNRTYHLSAYVGNNDIGFQRVDDILVQFEYKNLKSLTVVEEDKAAYPLIFDPYYNINYNTEEEKAKHNVKNIDNYPSRMLATFDDGTSEILDVEWNLSGIDGTYHADKQYAVARIGSDANSYQTFKVAVQMTRRVLGLDEINFIDNENGKHPNYDYVNGRFVYDLFKDSVIGSPNESGYYEKYLNKAYVNIDGKDIEFSIGWDASGVTVDAVGGTYTAYIEIGDNIGGIQRIAVPVYIVNRVISEITWDNTAAGNEGVIGYPVKINPYTETVNKDSLPKVVNLTFENGDKIEGYSNIRWDATMLAISYEGNTTYMVALVEMPNGVEQMVNVPVNVDRKVIRQVHIGPFEFDPFDMSVDYMSDKAYVGEDGVLVEFDDGTYSTFGKDGDGGRVIVDTSSLSGITYKGGLYNIEMRIGNSMGGMQTVLVDVKFTDRTIVSLANLDNIVVNDIYEEAPRNMAFYPKSTTARFANGREEEVTLVWNIDGLTDNFKGYRGGVYNVDAMVGNGRIGYQKISVPVTVKDRSINDDNAMLSYNNVTIDPYKNFESQLYNTIEITYKDGLVKTFGVEWIENYGDIILSYNAPENQKITARVGNSRAGYQDIDITVNVINREITKLSKIGSEEDILTAGITIDPYGDGNEFSSNTLVATYSDGTTANVEGVWNLGNLFIGYQGSNDQSVTFTYGSGILEQKFNVGVTVIDRTIANAYVNIDDAVPLTAINNDKYTVASYPNGLYVEYVNHEVGSPRVYLNVRWTLENEKVIASINSASCSDVQRLVFEYNSIDGVEAHFEDGEITVNPYALDLPLKADIAFTLDGGQHVNRTLSLDWSEFTFRYDGSVSSKNAGAVTARSGANSGYSYYTLSVPYGNMLGSFAERVKIDVKVIKLDTLKLADDNKHFVVNPYTGRGIPTQVTAYIADPEGGAQIEMRLDCVIDETSVTMQDSDAKPYDGGMANAKLNVGNRVAGWMSMDITMLLDNNRIPTESIDEDGNTIPVNYELTLVKGEKLVNKYEIFMVTEDDNAARMVIAPVAWSFIDMSADAESYTGYIIVGNMLGGYQRILVTVNVVEASAE